MPRNPKDIDIRVMIPRRSMAAWNRVSAQLSPLLERLGVEPTPANLVAAMIETMDNMTGGGGLPSADPNSPIEEWPDGTGMTVASGRIGRRIDPGTERPAEGVPIRPAPTKDD